MDKIIQFQTQDSLGHVFAEALDISHRSGGGFEKIAGELHPELTRFIASIKKDPRYQYVLMTPMGSYEYWGMNVNGDIFPEISLSFDHSKDDPVVVAKQLEEAYLRPFGKHLPVYPMKEFGYRTFLDALRYRHHVNKNPEIAYGDIVFAVYNPAMKRVELISRHDREKAKRVGADDIIRDLDEGRPRQISMGCKVPFDVCTICGHVSRTPHDYCVHLKTEMGTVREDGKVVGAVNFFPRFFDLSDVFIPAAKESGVIMKVASAKTASAGAVSEMMQSGLPSREAVNKAYPTWSEKKKADFLLDMKGRTKTASTVKVSALSKKVLPNAVSEEIIKRMAAREKSLPLHMLENKPFGKLLSTLSLSGIMLKPREFQYGMLHSMGKPDLARSLHSQKIVFVVPSRPPVRRRIIISARDFSPSIASEISPIISARSAFSPHLQQRAVRIMGMPKIASEETTHKMDDALLNKIAGLYTEYRDSVRTLPKELSVAVESNPSYYINNFFDESLSTSMSKLAASKNNSGGIISSPLYIWNVFRDDVSSLPADWETPSSHSLSSTLLGTV